MKWDGTRITHETVRTAYRLLLAMYLQVRLVLVWENVILCDGSYMNIVWGAWACIQAML